MEKNETGVVLGLKESTQNSQRPQGTWVLGREVRKFLRNWTKGLENRAGDRIGTQLLKEAP